MDDVYDLPYTGQYHPMYEKDGGIPALEEIKFSLTSNREAVLEAATTALTFHQGDHCRPEAMNPFSKKRFI